MVEGLSQSVELQGGESCVPGPPCPSLLAILWFRREHRKTSSWDSQACSDVITQTPSRPSLQLFLVFHAPVLKPDLDLSLGEYESLGEFPAYWLGDVHVWHVDAFQLGQLLFCVRTTLFTRWSRRHRWLEWPRVARCLTHGTTSRWRRLRGCPYQKWPRWNVRMWIVIVWNKEKASVQRSIKAKPIKQELSCC